MIEAVLIDLDGTLVPMETAEFLRAYMGSIGKYIAVSNMAHEPRLVVDHVNAAVYNAIKNDDCARSNAQVFWDSFSRLIGYGHEQYVGMFERYYADVFDEVGSGLSPQQGAAELINALKGKRLVLATNPLFPTVAIEKRLAWAGIDPGAFEFLTDYERMHRTKPHVEYYQEILSILGLCGSQCAMIGNDVQEDVLPALELGMTPFFLDTYAIYSAPLPASVASGGYKEAVEWARDLT